MPPSPRPPAPGRQPDRDPAQDRRARKLAHKPEPEKQLRFGCRFFGVSGKVAKQFWRVVRDPTRD